MTGQRVDIDLLLVCGARPSLLKQTLDSFSEKVFGSFSIANTFVNIDLFQGGPAEVSQTEAIVRKFFPDAVIRMPSTPSFTRAVIWLWSSVRSPFCLHLEDDWIADATIMADMIIPHFSRSVRQVSILTKEKNWPSSELYHCKWRRRRFLGIDMGRKMLRDEPVFTTSPSFLEAEFARNCAALMNSELDPEKQLYDGRNSKLGAYVAGYRNRVIGSGPPFLIRDNGRAFRKSLGVEKRIVDGRSVWIDLGKQA